MRNNPLELRQILLKPLQYLLPLRRIRSRHMLLNQPLQLQHVILPRDLPGGNHLLIQPLIQIIPLIQHISHAAAHARREILPRAAQHHNAPAGHILTAMVANALHHSRSSRIAHTEPFPGHAVYESLPTGSPIQSHIPDDDILTGLEPAGLGRIHNQLPPGKPLAKIVIAVPYQLQRQPLRNESPIGLPARAPAQHPVGVLLQIVPQPLRDLAAQNRPEGPVRVGHVHLQAPLLPRVYSLFQLP